MSLIEQINQHIEAGDLMAIVKMINVSNMEEANSLIREERRQEMRFKSLSQLEAFKGLSTIEEIDAKIKELQCQK